MLAVDLEERGVVKAELASVLAKRRPCVCGEPKVFGDRCRGCFVRRPLDVQIADLERLVLDAEARGDKDDFERYLPAYEAAVAAPRPPVGNERTDE